MMKELPDIKKIKPEISKIENVIFKDKRVSVAILRLDKIHPGISGNKFFKLYYFLRQALAQKKQIITFGGAYSNHLVATAHACLDLNIPCTGIIRGEEPKNLSHTLMVCKKNMRLVFISRKKYSTKDDPDFKLELINKFGSHILIPEGGFSDEGILGASQIPRFYSKARYTHICCAVGTAATFSGLIKGSQVPHQIIGFNVLKGITGYEDRIQLIAGTSFSKKYCLINDYHFGGYARKTDELILFMNNFYNEFKIPTDFVYTAKMMFGVFDLIRKNYFPRGSNILCIHSGGLQGNLSLPAGTLNF